MSLAASAACAAFIAPGSSADCSSESVYALAVLQLHVLCCGDLPWPVQRQLSWAAPGGQEAKEEAPMAPDLRLQDAEGVLRLCGGEPDGCGAASAHAPAAADPRLQGSAVALVLRLRGGAPQGGGAAGRAAGRSGASAAAPGRDASGGDAFGVGASVEVRPHQPCFSGAFELSQPACFHHTCLPFRRMRHSLDMGCQNINDALHFYRVLWTSFGTAAPACDSARHMRR